MFFSLLLSNKFAVAVTLSVSYTCVWHLLPQNRFVLPFENSNATPFAVWRPRHTCRRTRWCASNTFGSLNWWKMSGFDGSVAGEMDCVSNESNWRNIFAVISGFIEQPGAQTIRDCHAIISFSLSLSDFISCTPYRSSVPFDATSIIQFFISFLVHLFNLPLRVKVLDSRTPNTQYNTHTQTGCVTIL